MPSNVNERWHGHFSEIRQELTSILSRLANLQEEVCGSKHELRPDVEEPQHRLASLRTEMPRPDIECPGVNEDTSFGDASLLRGADAASGKEEGLSRKKKRVKKKLITSGFPFLADHSQSEVVVSDQTEPGTSFAQEALRLQSLAVSAASSCQEGDRHSNPNVVSEVSSSKVGAAGHVKFAADESQQAVSPREHRLSPPSEPLPTAPGCKSVNSMSDCPSEFMASATASKFQRMATGGSLKVDSLDLDEQAVVLRACKHNREESVKRMMQKTVDPNIVFEDVEIKGMKLKFCTPLAIAALRGQMSLVKFLINFEADVNSEYGFIAGARRMLWTGTVANVAVAAGNLALLQTFVTLRVNVHQVANNGASLVWQASYFNKAPILKYLLDFQIDVELRANCQDNEGISYTPLHSAAKGGHDLAVAALLDAGASTDVTDCDTHIDVQQVSSSPCRVSTTERDRETIGRCPLQDAIEHGHVKAVKLLIEHGANVVRITPDGPRCLDIAFLSRNAVLVASVAEGLKKSAANLDQLTRVDLIHFLQFDGEIPCLILQAVFQPYEIRIWEEMRNGGKRRTLLNVAFMAPNQKVLVHSGPHYGVLQDMFNSKQAPPHHTIEFLKALAPQEHSSGDTDVIFGPVRFLMCHIPAVHMHLDVLLALANTRNDSVFEEPGCRAILHHAAQKVKASSKMQVVIAGIEVLNLVSINAVLNTRTGGDWLLKLTNVLALFVAGVDIFLYLLEALGYWWQGLLMRFRSQWFNGVVLSGACATIIYLYLTGYEAKESALFNSFLGVLVFTRWMQFLFSLCQFRFFGYSILPITSAMLDIGPFCVVMLVCILGSTNLYYALGIHGPFESLMRIYRLIVLADVDLRDLENTASTQFSNMHVRADGAIVEGATERTDYYHVLCGMLILLSFLFAVSLMNLFIAVLTVSYSNATQKALVFFSRLKARKVIETQAIHIGYKVLMKYCRHRFQESKSNRGTTFLRGSVFAKQSSDGRSSLSSSGSSASNVSGSLSIRGRQRLVTAHMVRDRHDQFMWVCLPAGT